MLYNLTETYSNRQDLQGLIILDNCLPGILTLT